MAIKNKQNQENDKQPAETWRKPLQVPPRTDAMRAFYQGGNEDPVENVKPEQQPAAPPRKDRSATVKQKPSSQSAPKREAGNKAKIDAENEALEKVEGITNAEADTNEATAAGDEIKDTDEETGTTSENE